LWLSFKSIPQSPDSYRDTKYNTKLHKEKSIKNSTFNTAFINQKFNQDAQQDLNVLSTVTLEMYIRLINIGIKIEAIQQPLIT